MKKIKILTISDQPLSPSGVGMQTRYMIEGLLKTGKYQVISFGGAIKHQSYDPIKLEEYGDDWVIFPVDEYGTQDMVRSVLRTEKPDMIWFMTDPRFFGWLWEICGEVRPLVPLVYYHVWDNYPYPLYNKKYYDSNDVIVTISKVTDDIVRTVSPDVECIYHTHAVDTNIFRKLEDSQIKTLRKNQGMNDKFVFFYNNRNARRKMTGSIMFWFKEFLDEIGHDKATLLMHTDPYDPYGQDLYMLLETLGLQDGQVNFSTQKYPLEDLAALYNIADCTVNISDAEGFGLATLESLACETPIIINKTGGLQQQISDDGEYEFGVGIEPASKAIIGSQEVPYIYEDRIAKEDFIAALHKVYNMSKEEREEVGKKAREFVLKEHNFDKYCSGWDEILSGIHEKYGSWETRAGYKSWIFKEIA